MTNQGINPLVAIQMALAGDIPQVEIGGGEALLHFFSLCLIICIM